MPQYSRRRRSRLLVGRSLLFGGLTTCASAASDLLAHAATLRSAAHHRRVAGTVTAGRACRLHARVRRLTRDRLAACELRALTEGSSDTMPPGY